MLARATEDPRFAGLDRDGYCVLAELPQGGFDDAVASLGAVVDRTRVEVRPEPRTYLVDPAAMPFHTDHPAVDLIAWHCERQDEQDGASLLVDARKAIQPLRAGLADVRIACPPLSGLDPDGSWPLLWGSAPSVYYSPWCKASMPETARPAFEEFRAGLRQAPRIRVRLEPGQALVIDNHRMLHGRDAIDARSHRLLHRRWITRTPTLGSAGSASPA